MAVSSAGKGREDLALQKRMDITRLFWQRPCALPYRALHRRCTALQHPH